MQRGDSLEMPSSTISVFSEPEDLQAALVHAGYSGLLVTEGGEFLARLTRVVLHHLSVTSVRERLARVAFIALQPGSVRVSVPAGKSELFYGGTKVAAGAIVTHGFGRGLYERVTGPCEWRDIVLPVRFLERYGRALVGTAIVLPPGVHLWQPAAAAVRRLIALHAAATRIVEAKPGRATGAEAARGLEQELIEALVECLSGQPADSDVVLAKRYADTAMQFEEALRDRLETSASLAEICASLSVRDRTLRAYCHRQLDMGPNRYLRLRRMQLVRRTLRSADSDAVTVSQVARRYGFRELGRFSNEYRSSFGELPSATLRRNLGR
jgi:AraC-like DNA-binding protein